MTRTRPVWRRGALAAGVTAATVAATFFTPPAAVVAAPTPVRAAPPGDASLQATITLVTGDRVVYTESADGRAAATVTARAGRHTTFQSYASGTGYYVIPDDAMQYVASGMVDRELFDVKYLAHNGYGDDRAATLPVIVGYGKGVSARSVPARAAGLPGARTQRHLTSLNAQSVAVTKSDADEFWAAVPGGGLRNLWLDRKVRADLSESVPLVGAPEAWAAGYDGTGVQVAVLDTGVDEAHPDLAGQIAAERSFVEGVTSAHDGHGHGTHVASTVAGTAAASGGTYKGVAPGTRLLIGKVLDDTGSGLDSWIIDGMEWAATSGAKVVSMSLGGGPSDGTDALSQAVNDLTAATGTLFVIAAGNLGPFPSTVATPGSADSALTVAAVTKSDELAGFSSQGPRVGDRALKPDIAAPGVSIVAARSAGTTIPGAVHINEYYTSVSGTSMATPHVAAAAAILAQEHPDWTPAQLKGALMSTATDDGLTAYQQGAGRLDVARAVRQAVFAATPNLDYRTVPFDETAPISRQVTYTNTGDQDVTLDVTATLRDTGGQGAPDGALSADPTVTVPAGGTASVEVTLDPAALGAGTYSGAVVARAGDTYVTVPVGLVRQARLHKLTVVAPAPPGESVGENSSEPLFVWRIDSGPAPDAPFIIFNHLGDRMEGSVWLPEGVYTVGGMPHWKTRSWQKYVLAVEPEVVLSEDTTVTFDLGQAKPVRIGTPQPAEGVNMALGWTRTSADGVFSGLWNLGFQTGYGDQMFTLPSTTSAQIGTFKVFTTDVLAAPQVSMTVKGRGRTTVRAAYASESSSMPKFTGTRRLRLATYDDVLAGRDVRGALVAIGTRTGGQPVDGQLSDEVVAATRAGAAGVLDHAGLGPRSWSQDFARVLGIPLMWLDDDQWASVRAAIGTSTRPTVEITSRPVPAYEYKLAFYDHDRVPSQVRHSVGSRELTRLQMRYHLAVPTQSMYAVNTYESQHVFTAEDRFSSAIGHPFAGPVQRVEYHNQTGPGVLWERDFSLFHYSTPDWFDDERTVRSYRGFSTPSVATEDIGALPAVPGQNTYGPQQAQRSHLAPCMACRHGDRLYLLRPQVSAGSSSQWENANTTWDTHLYRDGTEIARDTSRDMAPYPLSAEPATYTLRMVNADRFTSNRPGTVVGTDWTFTTGPRDPVEVRGGQYHCLSAASGLESGPCTWLPLIQLRYPGLNLALDNTATADRAFSFTVAAASPYPGAPRVTGLRMRASYDDGAHWVPALAWPTGGGTYRVLLHHPELNRTSATVSLRAEAWDTAGNRVVQRIDRAYYLK